MRRLLRPLAILGFILILAIAGPVLWVETMCRGTPLSQAEARFIINQDDHRPEARTYLTYPEWHIVYAYEGYAEAVRSAPPHRFPYLTAVTGFWKSLCALTKEADSLGKAGFSAKSTVYTIGASFSLEMAAKALYEKTLGRLAAFTGTSPQDVAEAEMATQYAEFLQQTPWYKFDFDGWTHKLRALPTPNFRAHERRLALTLEWKAKAAYAGVIEKAVAGVGADALTMKIAVSGIEPSDFPSVRLVDTKDGVHIFQVARYRKFTKLAEKIAKQGGTILEIAGNDDILVSMILDGGDFYELAEHRLLSRTRRVGFRSDRILLSLKVSDLQTVFYGYPNTPVRVEHIYDY